MSKKDLARTAIEGGRRAHNRYAEKLDTRAQRRAYKVYCEKATKIEADTINDPGVAECTKGDQHRGKKRREFTDKLQPVKRWLKAQVGRPWNKIVSDIKKKFPSNTLAGRHILEHINGYVSDKPEDNPFMYAWNGYVARLSRGDLYVNDAGILCVQKSDPKKPKK